MLLPCLGHKYYMIYSVKYHTAIKRISGHFEPEEVKYAVSYGSTLTSHTLAEQLFEA